MKYLRNIYTVEWFSIGCGQLLHVSNHIPDLNAIIGVLI